ncbi:MAG: RNA polymerase sporulation sigma factor SigH [Lachnospiraceae bacterium]|jgi:RNA polymerase sporulation-specific sigma factor|nr:RNA polymerase sporulation sigma factor SigH [Lachnospiraceae bacterium]
MTSNYDILTDEQLIDEIRNGNEEATEYLIKKYSPLVVKSTRTLFLIGADSEDLTQEGMIGLFKAIQSFKQDNNASFFTFAQLCIKRQIYTAIKASNREKHSPLNSYISIYASSGESDIELIENLEADRSSDPEHVILNKENVLRVNELLTSRLSKMEQAVLPMYLEGLSYNDIAAKLGKSTKSIDNAISRIREKLKTIYPITEN